MPSNVPAGDNTPHAAEIPPFPADAPVLLVGADVWVGQAETAVLPVRVSNPHHAVLHIRFSLLETSWLNVVPSEVALGPGEAQTVAVRVHLAAAKIAAAQTNVPTSAPVVVSYRRIYPTSRHLAPDGEQTGTITVHLPIARCPHCERTLDTGGNLVPEVCPFCFERLRPCPVCATPNSWLARRCIRDPSHVVRAAPDWPVLGGGAEHGGSITILSPPLVSPALSRRWSFPSVPPSRRENLLQWSAPVAAYGMVAAAASTPHGDTHIYGFDALTGAPLWEHFPLTQPVYPDRGGVSLDAGRLFAATVEGVCVGLDALRGTRIWETQVGGNVYGAVVPSGGDGPLLVPVALGSGDGGFLLLLHPATGDILHRIPLGGVPDAAPAFANGTAFVHDDGGHLTAVSVETGTVLWQANIIAGTDAAPVVFGGHVFSATSAGEAWSHDAKTGKLLWRLAVTNAPLGGTPACDGTLLYLPSGDGLHLVSAETGRAVRRYPSRTQVRAAPLVLGGLLFYGTSDGVVYGGQSARTPEKQYETGGISSQIIAAPAFADGAVFVAATNGVMYALQTAA